MRINTIRSCATLCAALMLGHFCSAQLVINEFMASNAAAINDPDYDESADWIELFNGTASAIDLTGYYLTDNLSDTTKWAIPAGTTIPANGYLLFWADTINIGMHTNFKLLSAGEEIGLYDVDLNLVDGFVYGSQDTDISYGRQTDGSTTWSWFAESTPGASNNTVNAYDGITYYQPFFSVYGGFYDGTQSVELTSLGGVIRYTLDGREPTLNSALYTEPIVFDTATFIRARVYQDNYIPGPTVTQSYFFDPTFAERGLPVVSLVTDPDFFWDPVIGIYVQDFKPDWEHPLNIELFENDGNNQSVFNHMAGVKVNGLWSWQLPQKMLGIYFRNEYGGSLDYPIFADRERNSYDEFILRASGSDWSFTLFRDGLGQDLVQENAPMYKQGFRPSIVFINGEYMGIHNMRSRSSGEELEYMYGVAPNSYDIIDNDGELEEGSTDQYWVMDGLFNTDLTNPDNYAALAGIVDLENFSDYWITEIWSSNSSWGHNVKLWKPHDGGKWQFIFGDLDRGFSGSTNDPIAGFSVPLGGDGYDYARYWLQHIFQNADFAKYFAQRFNDHLYTSFHPLRVSKKIDEFKNRLVPEIAYHVERWAGTTSNYGDGIPSVNFWENQVEALRQFADVRQSFMMTDLQNTFGLSSIVSLGTSSLPAAGGNIRLNEFKVPGSPWSGPYFTNLAFELSAVPNPGYVFEGWSVSQLTEVFGLGQSWKYLDNGSNQGEAWKQLGFNDASWSSGNAELGYGDGDETTVVSFGPDVNNKYITTYFRKTFQYTGTDSEPVSALINVRRDDGVVIYHNGVEIARSNMPAGTIDYLTGATEAIGGTGETALNEFLVEITPVNGTNVIAAEIHQFNGQSSDISFDMSLSLVLPSPFIISTDTILPVTLSQSTGYIARYVPTGACILPDTISQNTTLTIDCSPYMASGNTTVLPDISLTVDPGVEVWFPEQARLIVQGELHVNGTESQGVLFKENAQYNATSWGNVSFENSTGVSELHYLELRNATEGPHPIHDRAAITGWFSEVVMDHLTLTNNLSNPIFGEYSDFTVTNSLIHSDVTGDLINVKYGNGYVSDCTFIGNDQPDTDAIDYDDVTDGVVRNSSFEGLRGFNSDAIDLGEGSSNILVENCFINDITDKAISVGQGAHVICQNNTIVNCALGLGIKDLGSADIDHTTFYSVVTPVAAFEKNPGFGGGTFALSNSILSNSSLTPISVDELSSAVAENNFYDTDTMPGETNFWMDPLFVDPTHYDFTLQSNSPALLAGMDGEDLGTLDHTFTAEPKVMFSDIEYYHPVNPNQEFIKIYNPGSEPIDLGGYSISIGIYHVFAPGIVLDAGEKIMLVKDMTFFPDETGQMLEWDSGQLENNGELLLLSDPSGIVVDHVDYQPESPWPIPTLENEYISLVAPSLDNHFGTSWSLIVPEPDAIDETSLSQVSVFPNPASDRVFFQSSEIIESIDLYDVTGRMIGHIACHSSVVEIDVHKLSEGVYTASLNGHHAIHFLVKG